MHAFRYSPHLIDNQGVKCVEENYNSDALVTLMMLVPVSSSQLVSACMHMHTMCSDYLLSKEKQYTVIVFY